MAKKYDYLEVSKKYNGADYVTHVQGDNNFLSSAIIALVMDAEVEDPFFFNKLIMFYQMLKSPAEA